MYGTDVVATTRRLQERASSLTADVEVSVIIYCRISATSISVCVSDDNLAVGHCRSRLDYSMQQLHVIMHMNTK